MLDMLGLSVATRQEHDHAEWGSWIRKAVVRQGKMVSWRRSQGTPTLRGQGDKEKPIKVIEQWGEE